MVYPAGSRSNSSNSLYSSWSDSEDESNEVIHEEHSKGSPVLNVATTVVKAAYSYQRPGDENFLFLLTGNHQIRDAINKFTPKLCGIIKTLFPEYYSKIAGKNPLKVSAIIEDLALHVLANFGKALFGNTPEAKVTKEVFFGKLGYFLISLIWKHLSEVEKKNEVDEDSFKLLAQELLQVALPKNQEGLFASLFAFGEQKVASGYLLKPLSNFLLYIYQKFVLRTEESSSTNMLGKMEDLKEYLAIARMGMAFFLQAFASHIIDGEDQFFGYENDCDERVSSIINCLLSTFDDQINALLPSEYKEFLPDIETIRLLAVSLIMKILGSVGRKYLDECEGDDQEIPIDELFQHITNALLNKTHKAYNRILAVLEKKYRPKTRYFRIFVHNVLAALLPEHTSFFHLLAKRFPELENLICEVARDFILAIDTNNQEDDIQELRTLLWNKQEVLAKHPTLEDEDLPDIPGKGSSSPFGNERLVENILGISSMLGEKSLSHIKEFIGSKELQSLACHAFPSLSGFEILPDILSGVSQAILGDGKGVTAFLGYLQKWIGTIIFKGCVIFLSNTSKKKIKVKYILPFATRKLISVLGKHFSMIHQNISNSFEDDELHYRFFIPMVTEVTQLFFQHGSLKSEFKKILPLPIWMQTKASELLTTYALPKLANKCYKEMTVWESQRKDSRKLLVKLFGDKKVIEFCRVLSEFAPEFLAYFFRTSSNDLAAILVGHFKAFLKHSSPKELQRMNHLIAYAIEYIGVKQDSYSKLWEFITFFSYDIFLKMFADFFEKIDELESFYLDDPRRCFEGSINIRLVLEFIESATKHFQTVNQIKKSYGETRASRVPDQVMLKGFKQSKELPEFEKFFKEFSQQVLVFMDLDEYQELPLPKIGRSLIWQLFESELFPKLLNALFMKFTSLPSIQKLVLSSLQRVNETINNIENEPAKRRKKKNGHAIAKIHDDHLQRELIQMIADLVGTVVDLQPSRIAQIFLEYRSIRDAVGDAIAGALRNQLEDSSTLDLCNQAIGSAITSLHEGEWVEGSKSNIKDRFIPKKRNSKGKLVKGFDFQLPKTKAEEKEMQAKKKADEEKIASEVVQELSGMISTQTKLTVDAGLKGMWNKFQKFLDDEIEQNFDEFGVKVKHKLDEIMHAIFTILIYPVIKIIIYPFAKLIWLFLDCYFQGQSKGRANDLGIPVNKYLFAEVIDASLGLLQQRKEVLTES